MFQVKLKFSKELSAWSSFLMLWSAELCGHQKAQLTTPFGALLVLLTHEYISYDYHKIVAWKLSSHGAAFQTHIYNKL